MNHLDRPARAKGLCNSCYTTQIQKRKRAEARALKPKVDRRHKTRTSQTLIRVTNPETAQLVARAAIKHQLDYEAAVKELKPELTPYEVNREAQRLRNDPAAQEAVEQEMKALGYDDDSMKRFLQEITTWFYGDSKELKKTAANILKDMYISKRLDVNKPTSLRIEGFEEGIKHMLGEEEDASTDDTIN